MTKNRKVIRIQTSVFIKKINAMNIETCTHVKDALDISDLHFDIVKSVIMRLHELGYKDTKLVEVK